jgi:hypothetical protein
VAPLPHFVNARSSHDSRILSLLAASAPEEVIRTFHTGIINILNENYDQIKNPV